MKKFLSLLLPLFVFSNYNITPQQPDHNYFQKNIEVYFSFQASSTDLIRELTNVISIDNVKENTVFAYANEKEYAEFLSYNIEHTILPKPGELINPKMSDNIIEITDWDVYPTYEGYVNLMTQFATNYPSR
jgi:hypothetical protein